MPDGADRPLVCHICAPGDVGGLERVIQGLALGHHQRGLQPEVISVIGPDDDDPHPFAAPLLDGGVPVHELRLHPRAYLAERRAVRRLLETRRPRVVHFHGYRPDILHGSLARSLGIATVTTEHGSSKLGGTAALFEWVQTKLFRRASGVVAVSTPIAERLVNEDGVPGELVHMIPNGWTPGTEFLSREAARRELGIGPEETLVAFVGRLIPAKGPDVFVDALLQVESPSVTALVIGDGADRTELEERVRAAGQEDRFRFMGTINPAAPLFRAFDLFVLSSRTEGTPIVLLEAMAAGVPLVVTAVGGVPDVVGDDAALVVPPLEPSTMADAVRSALADPAAARGRVEAATRRVENEFSADLWLDRHEALYRSVAADPA
jgi:glycosyltransferase involved in cell wall biosynthesis